MTFDELEECWKNDLPNGHHSRPTDLKQHAIAAASRAEFKATVFELYVTAIFSLLGLVTLADAIRDTEPWHSYLSPLITLGIAAFVYSSRRRRRQQIDFSASLAEIIESRLRAVDTHINRVKAFLWWFVVPTTLAFGVNLVFNFGDRPLWVWGILPLGVAAVWLAMMIELRASYLPHRQTLRSLQARLARDA